MKPILRITHCVFAQAFGWSYQLNYPRLAPAIKWFILKSKIK